MVSLLKVLAYGVGGMAVAGVALLAAFQERLIYVPVLPGMSKAYPFTPARFRLNYEDVWLRASDGVRLHAWFIKHHPECAGSGFSGSRWLCSSNNPFLPRECRQYPELFSLDIFSPIQEFVLSTSEEDLNCCPVDIAHRLEYIRIMLQRLQCNVFMLSYRGYGASDGYPSQHGITKDAQAALDHLLQRTDIDTSRIVVFGRSLGGAVGSVLVRSNPDKVSALILENTFTSILDMAEVVLPILKWFIGGSGTKGPKVLNFLVRSPWSTIDIIGQIKPPLLFLSGLQDELVPPSHMRMLHDRAVENNRRCLFVDFPTGMHMDTWLAGGERYWRTIQLFLNQYVPGKEESVTQCSDDNDDDYDGDDDDDTEAG